MLFLLLLAPALSTCTDNLSFTECSELGTRKAILYQSGDCTPSQPTVSEDLSCDFSCDPNYFLDFSNSKQVCSQCPIGTYSLGGSLVIGLGGTPWSEYLPNLINTCWSGGNPNANCTHWSVSNQLLVSGSSSIDSSYTSQLKFTISLKKQGKLIIIYRKEAQSAKDLLDFSVKINKVKKLTDGSNGKVWNNFVEELMPGAYQVEIEVMKDPGNQPASKVSIHSVTIQGAFFSDVVCTACHSSMPAFTGDNCLACDYNEYFDEGECVSCPQGSYSHRGSNSSSACLPMPKCSMKDIMEMNSSCVGGEMTTYFQWKSPMMCDNSSSSLPPSMSNLPCVPCPNGHVEVLNGMERDCVPCSNGEFLSGSGKEARCEKCPAGKVSENQAFYGNWTEIPEFLGTYCKEASGNYCRVSDGWMPMSQYISTGVNLLSGVHLYLESKISIVAFSGTFNFTYELLGQQPVIFEVYVDGGLHKTLSSSSSKSTEIISLSQGQHIINLVYTAANDPTEEVRIYQITITGSTLGGASECIQCPVGFISPTGSSSCSPCPASTSSNSNNTQCVACPNNKVNPISGNKCLLCPTGSTNNSNSTMCVAQSFLTFSNSSYFLYALSNMSLNPEQENVCSSISSQLYCYGTFYGPIDSKHGDFYLSVINPSLLALPGISYYGTASVGYSYGVFKEKAKVAVDEKDLCRQEERIVNLGKEFVSVQESLLGITVDYAQGDVCEGGGRFGSRLHVLCDKGEEYGWPSVSSYNSCSVAFTWKSKFGCRICKEEEMKKVVGECRGGLQNVSFIEGENCVSIKKYAELSQVCKDGEYKKELFVVYAVIGFCGILAVVWVVFYVRGKGIRVPLEDVTKPKQNS